MTLPPRFLIRRNNDLISEEVFAFVTSGKDDRGKYVFDILPVLPGTFIRKAEKIYSDLIKNKKYSIQTSRYSKEKGRTLEYETEFWYEGLVASVHDLIIPIVNMYKACQVLPGKFVYLEKPIFSEFAVRLQEEITLNPALSLDKYLKDHPDELCPILLTPLEETTLCLTPCGHGVTHSAMIEWLYRKNQCPVCRHPCHVSNLLRPKRS
jgi:hypothetical protein